MKNYLCSVETLFEYVHSGSQAVKSLLDHLQIENDVVMLTDLLGLSESLCSRQLTSLVTMTELFIDLNLSALLRFRLKLLTLSILGSSSVGAHTVNSYPKLLY